VTRHISKALSHKHSGSRSPTFASAIIFCAIASRVDGQCGAIDRSLSSVHNFAEMQYRSQRLRYGVAAGRQ
jgi:hypothetical protein